MLQSDALAPGLEKGQLARPNSLITTSPLKEVSWRLAPPAPRVPRTFRRDRRRRESLSLPSRENGRVVLKLPLNVEERTSAPVFAGTLRMTSPLRVSNS
jgi:hypothetical protein